MAATVALKKLEDQLKCSTCRKTYTNPKQLQCHHVYCQQCLVVREEQGQFSVTCPTCDQVTPIPDSGMTGLQAAFQIHKFLEIVEEQKKAKVVTASPEKAESASTKPAPYQNITVCSKHGRKEVELYCETCEEMICWRCTLRGEKHKNHKFDKLEKIFGRYKGEIMSVLEPLEKQVETTITKALVEFDTRHDEISSQQASIEADINSTIMRLQKTLDVRKSELISQLDKLTQAKLKSLAAKKDRIQITQAQQSTCLLFIRESLKTIKTEDIQGEVSMMKSITVQQVNELATTFQPGMLVPNTEADMIFSVLANLSAECQSYGEVFVAGPPDPTKCSATIKGLDTAEVEKISTGTLQMLNFGNLPCQASVANISCELVSEMTDIRARGRVEKRGQSHYKISYQPTIKGRHQLHIKVEGQHIRGSPFPVIASSLSVENLGTPILTIDGAREPTGVAVNQRGEVVVTELGWTLRYCVQPQWRETPIVWHIRHFSRRVPAPLREWQWIPTENILVADQRQPSHSEVHSARRVPHSSGHQRQWTPSVRVSLRHCSQPD